MDSVVLANYIKEIRTIKKSEWTKEDESLEVNQLSYPEYPAVVEELFNYLNRQSFYDVNYLDNMERIEGKAISLFTKEEVKSYLTSLKREERYGDGVIAEAIELGLFLKVLLRLEDILQKEKADKGENNNDKK
ncbi:hypothetical protein SAMN04488700_0999 [Carnobacterium iners]|uniref:Uncharacterized protein n=1 Tax=Carnobacterium iners TaxID=1073423 RepID=A0A1X7MW08_9LACT|nr:DUF6508 domain-containing protein [Carnobacterium iners]SEL26393.1 hypothetical protein SAMN04488114_1439 [Carnobacterium iners]SMH28887.1 hypothetical protein SAMN04488700_0999 [Carnobacterium iners]